MSKLSLTLAQDDAIAFAEIFTADHAKCLFEGKPEYSKYFRTSNKTMMIVTENFTNKEPCNLIIFIIKMNSFSIAKWLNDRGYFDDLDRMGTNYLKILFDECKNNDDRIMTLLFDHVNPAKLTEIFEIDCLEYFSPFAVRYLSLLMDINLHYDYEETWYHYLKIMTVAHVSQSDMFYRRREHIRALIDSGIDVTVSSGYDDEAEKYFSTIEAGLDILDPLETCSFKYAYERRSAIKEALANHGLIPDLAMFVESFTFKCTELLDLFVKEPVKYCSC